MKIPGLLKFVILMVIAYGVLMLPGLVSGKPVPRSLVSLYLFFAAVMTLLVLTSTDEGAAELFSPIRSLALDPSRKAFRAAVFALFPLLAALLTHLYLRGGGEAPARLRVVHPAPPAYLDAYGKRFDMLGLKNPLRPLEKTDPARFTALVSEGGEIYFRDCFFCHGAKLDGKGHYSSSIDPSPLPFTGADTIAQLEESYVFWRVVKGGPGLPDESSPALSAMPSWEKGLSEEEVWKVILFLYDYTGNKPRPSGNTTVPEISTGTVSSSASAGESEKGGRGGRGGRAIYLKRCSWCHGREGAGDGAASESLMPAPRDFTMGVYKWKSTPVDEYAPSKEDILSSIRGPLSPATPGWDGLSGTSMPGWRDVLSEEEIHDVASYILGLGGLEIETLKPPVEKKGAPRATKEGMERGRRGAGGAGLFDDRCSECHGRKGRGDAKKRLKDDWGGRTWPRDLTKGWTFRAGNTVEDIYTRVTAGIPGTQMPAFSDPKSRKVMTDEERWDVAAYAASLDEPERTPGRGVINALYSASLPEGPDEESWKTVPMANLPMFPQIIAGERLSKPSIDSISVRIAYGGEEAAFLLEWDDHTESVLGDKLAEEIAGGEVFPDAVAVQFPQFPMYGGASDSSGAMPYFGMGDKTRPVLIWLWQRGGAGGVKGYQETAKVMRARGFEDIVTLERETKGLVAKGSYDNGRWRVYMRGPLPKGPGEEGGEGREGGDRVKGGVGVGTLPLAFAAWDGSNGDRSGKHVLTGWVRTSKEEERGAGVYIWPAVAGVIVLAIELSWLRKMRRGRGD